MHEGVIIRNCTCVNIHKLDFILEGSLQRVFDMQRLSKVCSLETAKGASAKGYNVSTERVTIILIRSTIRFPQSCYRKLRISVGLSCKVKPRNPSREIRKTRPSRFARRIPVPSNSRSVS